MFSHFTHFIKDYVLIGERMIMNKKGW